MFADWEGVWDVDLGSEYMIDFGNDIKNFGELVHWGPAVYWSDTATGHEIIWHIADPQTMTRYHFKRDTHQPSQDPTILASDLRMLQWRPIYNGLRVGAQDAEGLFLIDAGRKRRIADPTTYRALFGADTQLTIDTLKGIPDGDPIGANTRLIQAPGGPGVFLQDGDWKRHIADLNTLKYYGFAGGNVQTISLWELTEIPERNPIRWPDRIAYS